MPHTPMHLTSHWRQLSKLHVSLDSPSAGASSSSPREGPTDTHVSRLAKATPRASQIVSLSTSTPATPPTTGKISGRLATPP